jgi:hypothetical protein
MSDTLGQERKLDARTFQKPLAGLAETLAQKVSREAPALLPGPKYIAVDLHVLTRQAMRTYDLLFYLNADDRRETDCYWKPVYTIITLPLIRNMIDCLYNITAILEDPRRNGPWFRKSGYWKRLKSLEDDQARYGGQPKWDAWIQRNRSAIDFDLRLNGLTIEEVRNHPQWPTLGKYIGDMQPGGVLTPNQQFLKTFTYGAWREYSAMAHGAFEGLMPVAMYYIPDSMPFEERPKLDEVHPVILSLHLGRAAAVLLCIATELQAYFHFDGARIGERIHRMWAALLPAFDAKELYNERYLQLMKDRHINP